MRYQRNNKSALLLLILMLVGVLVGGCGESSDPEVSSWPSGNGYKVILAVTPDSIERKGTATVIATVFDPEGKPVADEEDAVMFTASAADTTFEVGTSETNVGNIIGGTSQIAFKWEDDSDDDAPAASELCTITASYRGAIASVQILLISKSY